MILDETEITLENRDEVLRKNLTDKQLRWIRKLSEQELNAIVGTGGIEPIDFYFIARARYSDKKHYELAKRIDKNYRVKEEFFYEYRREQINWIAREKKLLENNLKREANSRELIQDFQKYENGIAFKLFFCLKYGDRIERCR